MAGGWEKRRKRPGEQAVRDDRSAADIARELQGERPKSSYRDQSLRIHGLICGRCGREFEEKNRQLLTVHHRDGNHNNNPPDGSNWENLCRYCHDDAHSRQGLGRYYSGEGGDGTP